MVLLDTDAFEQQTASQLNALNSTASLEDNQVHLYSFSLDKKIVEFDVIPSDGSDNFDGEAFASEVALDIAKQFTLKTLAYNFSGTVPKYDIKYLQIRKTEGAETLVDDLTESKSNNPFDNEPDRTILIIFICIAGASVLLFVVWMLGRNQSPQYPQFGSYPSNQWNMMNFMQPPFTPGGNQMGSPMKMPSFQNPAGVGMPGATPYAMSPGNGAGGWGTARAAMTAMTAFGQPGGQAQMGGMQQEYNPSYGMPQQAGAGGMFSPRFYMAQKDR